MVAVPDGGRAAEANAADCLALADTAAAERCFRDLMAADPDAAARLIGAALCAKLGDGTADQVTDRNVALCVRLWRNRVVLAELSTMYGMCPGWMCSDALERALRHAIEADPSLIDLLEDEISPELLFDAEQNVFPIVAARELWLLRASDRTKKILRSGAMGQSGGTTLQVDYAALMSASLVTDPMERLAFVTDVASSPSLPDGVDRVGMGSTMMHLLYDRSIREGLTERELVEATIELLNSEQLGIGAAGHLLDLLTDAPPPITEATWEEVRAHAKLRYDG